MQIDLLKEIVSSIVGSSGNPIVDLLYEKKNVNEFIIAKKLNMTINQTRNVLYKLSDEGLVSFLRKKDKKKGGWYTYFWTLNSGKGLNKFKEVLDKELKILNEQYSLKKDARFYECKNGDGEFNEETALLNNYSCLECGEILILKDSTNEIKEIEKNMRRLQQVLEKVNLEIGEINKKDVKTKERRAKVEKKKKQEERAAKKKKKQLEMKKSTKATKSTNSKKIKPGLKKAKGKKKR
jgi:transcription factor E